MSADFDIFVIGGGINGCGIARDAAGRGYSVALCEMADLGSGTSSGSTKLIHGGLRYLEHFEFRLVQKALSEREVLWANAPHIIWPLRFVLPYHKGLRPAWLLRLGLFIYDYIGGRKKLPPTKTISLAKDIVGGPLTPSFTKAFEYSDCGVNDSRLVVLNAMDARALGAVIETRTKCISAVREDGMWHITTEDLRGNQKTRTAGMLINAAGPWVDDVLREATLNTAAHNVRLVQGSHIVVPKIFDHDRCYIFQNADDRIIFAIPYEQKYTLIGTTDRDYDGDPAAAKISDVETDYLCNAAGAYFKQPIRKSDIVWTYSAIRPLFDDGASAAQEATRDYVLRQDGGNGNAPVLNIFGGKITTYRRLAESALTLVEENLGRKKTAWTKTAPLPGGDFPMDGFDDLTRDIRKKYPFLADLRIERLARAYGTDVFSLLGAAQSAEELGANFGAGLTEAEVVWMMDHEFAGNADDALWRRSKLGIEFSPEQTRKLDDWMQAYSRQRVPAAED